MGAAIAPSCFCLTSPAWTEVVDMPALRGASGVDEEQTELVALLSFDVFRVMAL